jgi:hypothetical protein
MIKRATGQQRLRLVRWRDEDVPRLSRLCDLRGLVRVWGALVPYVLPLANYDDPADFDRALVRAGLPEFLRPRHPGDWPAGAGAGSSVWVRRLAKGCRVRLALDVVYPMEN